MRSGWASSVRLEFSPLGPSSPRLFGAYVDSSAAGVEMAEETRSPRLNWGTTGPLVVGLVVAVVAAWIVVPRGASRNPVNDDMLYPTVEAGTLDNPAEMGDVVDGPVRVKVADPEWSGSTLVLDVQVANTTDRPQQVRPTDFQAMNPITEATYPAASGSAMQKPLSPITLEPGDIARGQIAFTMPSIGVNAIVVDRSGGKSRAWETITP
jgi:hypothetical protein